MKTAICKIEYDGWDGANSAKIKSPSGRSIIVKARFNNSISEELKELFVQWDHYYNIGFYSSGNQKFEAVLSYSLMRELLSIAM